MKEVKCDMKNGPVEISKIIIEKNMKYMDTPVLHYKIEYPRFGSPYEREELEPINRWYRDQAMELQRKYETENYAEAVELFESSRDNQFPFHMFEALSVYNITYNQNDLLSLYYDHYTYSGGAHGITIRASDTWSLNKGCRIGLYQLCSDPERMRRLILDRINEQIAAQIKSGEGMYFDDYAKLTAENFNPENYYLTPEGIVVYYQQYDIAPYASGIPEFIVPLTWRG
jgi:hypothetical protein